MLYKCLAEHGYFHVKIPRKEQKTKRRITVLQTAVLNVLCWFDVYTWIGKEQHLDPAVDSCEPMVSGNYLRGKTYNYSDPWSIPVNSILIASEVWRKLSAFAPEEFQFFYLTLRESCSKYPIPWLESLEISRRRFRKLNSKYIESIKIAWPILDSSATWYKFSTLANP
jgi:hypothetical protein